MPQDEFTGHLNAFLERARPHWKQETFDLYRQRFADLVHTVGVDSYDKFYALLRAPRADEAIRITAFDLITRLPKIDKRRVIGPLLTELRDTAHSDLRSIAAQTLGTLNSRRAVEPLLAIARDKNEDETMRLYAILGLGAYYDSEIAAGMLPMLTDVTDNPKLRGVIADQLCHAWDERALEPLIQCLSDDSAEVRFWACFGVYTIGYEADLRAVLPILDHIAATDTGYGDHFWAVRREVLAPLEYISYAIRTDCQPSDDRSCDVHVYLVSPLKEYQDFSRASGREENGEWVWIPLEQKTDLHIDPAWLAEQLRARWLDVRINVRQPKLQSLLLDWEIGAEDSLMLGGLLNDGFAITLTGDKDKIVETAIWLREIIPAQHKLTIYGWADPGREITPDIADWFDQPLQGWYKPNG